MISSRWINEIVARIVERFHPEKVILFGSHARGDSDSGSDVDLLIVATTDLSPPQRYAAVCRLIADQPAPIDVVFKTPQEYQRGRGVVNHVVYFADKYGKVVYER